MSGKKKLHAIDAHKSQHVLGYKKHVIQRSLQYGALGGTRYGEGFFFQTTAHDYGYTHPVSDKKRVRPRNRVFRKNPVSSTLRRFLVVDMLAITAHPDDAEIRR
jgi:LmbE family N-acetylglucosaminyl deacetylase